MSKNKKSKVKATVKVEKAKKAKKVGEAKVAIKPKFGDGHVPGFLTEKIVATVKAKRNG